jgi:hypothetical protein
MIEPVSTYDRGSQVVASIVVWYEPLPEAAKSIRTYEVLGHVSGLCAIFVDLTHVLFRKIGSGCIFCTICVARQSLKGC